MSKVRIGVDIGGQTIKIGAKTSDSSSRAQKFRGYSLITDIKTDPDFLMAGREVSRIILETFGKPELIAVGCFGPLDMTRHLKRILLAPPPLDWIGADFGQWEDILHCPVILENDANLAIYGEAIVGSGKDYPIVAGFTLGTGIGDGITMTMGDERYIYRGNWDVEGGHMVLDPQGAQCVCGQRGCLQTYIARDAIVKKFHKEPHELEDERAWDWIAHKIAWGIQIVTVTVKPDIFVLCGGMAQHSGLIGKVRKHYEAMLRIYPKEATQTKIAIGSLIPHSGVIGAIELAESAK